MEFLIKKILKEETKGGNLRSFLYDMFVAYDIKGAIEEGTLIDVIESMVHGIALDSKIITDHLIDYISDSEEMIVNDMTLEDLNETFGSDIFSILVRLSNTGHRWKRAYEEILYEFNEVKSIDGKMILTINDDEIENYFSDKKGWEGRSDIGGSSHVVKQYYDHGFYDFDNLIYDFEDQLIDNMSDANLIFIKNYIVEKHVNETVDLNDLNSDYFSDLTETDELILSAEIINNLNLDAIGNLIKNVDSFSDLNDALRSAYTRGYESAYGDMVHESIIESLVKGFGPKTDTPNGYAFEITDLFWEAVTSELEYSGYIYNNSSLISLLSEYEEDFPLVLSLDDYPDHIKTETYYNEEIEDRINEI